MSLADIVRHTEGMVRLRARWVLPVEMPPIENGEVHIENGEIAWVGRASGREPTADLGLCAILPGLINAHAHLEDTVLRGLLENLSLPPFLQGLAALKIQLSLEDRVVSATLGAGEMLAAGITTVGDCADSSASLTALLTSGLRGIAFREVFGIERDTNTETIVSVLRKRVGEMRDQIERHHAEERVAVGIAPHAAYAVSAELFQEIAGYAAPRGLRQAVHVAESAAEDRLVRQGAGAFAEQFRQRAVRWETPGVSSVRYLSDRGVFDAPTLALHCVHTDEADAALLREKNVAVVHCPRSSNKLATGTAPLLRMRKAGVPLGLGTGWSAANLSTDFFEEMRAAVFAARAREQSIPALSAREALRMATLGGATALGLEQEIGSLRHGKRADLCVVRLEGLHMTPTAEDSPEAALVYSARASDVLLTIVGGQVVYETGTHPLLDMGRLRASVAQTRQIIKREAAKALASITTSAEA